MKESLSVTTPRRRYRVESDGTVLRLDPDEPDWVPDDGRYGQEERVALPRAS